MKEQKKKENNEIEMNISYNNEYNIMNIRVALFYMIMMIIIFSNNLLCIFNKIYIYYIVIIPSVMQ
jgi:hypothetical protein